MCYNGLLNSLVVAALILAHELPNLLILVVIDFILEVLRPVKILLYLLE